MAQSVATHTIGLNTWLQCVPPPAAEKLKNSKKRRKKLSNCTRYKNMNDQNEGSPKCEQKMQRSEANAAKMTKIYSPLKDFVELDMELSDLYKELLPYVLQANQQMRLGFPTPPLESGSPTAENPVEPNERFCCRCGEKFNVDADGSYDALSCCRYHRGKMTYLNGIPGAGPYACCNGSYLSEGCVTNKYHVSAQSFTKQSEFVKTRDKRYPNLEQSHTIYALDCEMCYTTNGLEVTKVGVVGPDGLTVYDSYVLPERQVLDYNTTYSGVTADSLKNVSITLTDVQAFLMKLLNKNTILVGHGLENDLKALHIMHETVVDTSVVFPHKYGGRNKRSLKSLAADFLNKTIQDGDNGHNSIEDARTCMELVLLKIKTDKENRANTVLDENMNYVQPEICRQELFSSDVFRHQHIENISNQSLKALLNQHCINSEQSWTSVLNERCVNWTRESISTSGIFVP